MSIKNIFKYLFVLIVPSVIVSFAANSIILVLTSVISIWLLRRSPPRDVLNKYLVFNAFTISVLIGFFVDLLNENTLDFNQFIKRLSFVLMPIIFCAASRQIQNLALKTYVFFLTILSSTLLISGFIRGVLNKNQIIYGNWDSETTERFYESEMLINWGELSYKRLFFFFDMHPSYYALFSIIAVMVLVFTQTIRLKKSIKWTLVLIHVLMIVLASSKTGVISLFILVIAYLSMAKSKKHVLISVSALFILVLIIAKVPSTEIRIKRAYKSMTSDDSLMNKNSSSERLILWKSLSDLSYKELFLGVGNVGGKNILLQNTGIDKNMHNQFLQNLLNSGIFGFFLLIIFVISPLFFKRNVFTVSLISIVFLNLLFENMLDRVWGITAISFFYAFIIFGSSEMLNFKSEID
jgi:O-antigen ligase